MGDVPQKPIPSEQDMAALEEELSKRETWATSHGVNFNRNAVLRRLKMEKGSKFFDSAEYVLSNPKKGGKTAPAGRTAYFQQPKKAPAASGGSRFSKQQTQVDSDDEGSYSEESDE
ncbi:hypothetical protein KIPB_009292 [Kipferlia bialata]|uniref:Uncharacterized protein n=1 Tax=Kipferlia bialata TaxID=797122 RepID=A0A391NNS7_9EUKA|nr:hypothetical protein KIPB_009292 [Kipferlia bialata]|eukprot:g9292.t1